VLTHADIDRTLEQSAPIDATLSVRQLRGWRDDLVHAALLLSYACHVLSVDLDVLHSIAAADPGDELDAVIEDLPRRLAAASIGGGWSLSPDATVTMASAGQVQEGEADALMSAHSQVPMVEFHSPEAVDRAIGELEAQLTMAKDRLGLVEAKVGDIQAVLVQLYKTGDAATGDWVD
jgi:hypothetical protein